MILQEKGKRAIRNKKKAALKLDMKLNITLND